MEINAEGKVDMKASYLNPPKEFSECKILKGVNFIQEIHEMIGYASKCWDKDMVFETEKALGCANELCLLARKYMELKESKGEKC